MAEGHREAKGGGAGRGGRGGQGAAIPPPPLVPLVVDGDSDVARVSVRIGSDVVMDLLDEDAKLGVPTDDWD